VARGLKDVLQFQEEIWRAEIVRLERPSLQLEVSIGDAGKLSAFPLTGSRSLPARPSSPSNERARKRRRTGRDSSSQSDFVLEPLTHSVSDDTLRQIGETLARPVQGPSRLQTLLDLRGGEACIDDEELFGPGELQGMLRTEDEVAALESEGLIPDMPYRPERAPKVKRSSSDEEQGLGSKRINMAAFNQLMGEGDGGWIDDDWKSETSPSEIYQFVDDDGTQVEPWRPVSPGASLSSHIAYDEEV
jgi:transcription factor IIIB 90 kDa subunit